MIRLLDKETIDRIAAGEVVENPRSVVKELVENSFDAGAKRVTVQIKDGGRSLIRVSDDGCGIEQGEVLTAFERHATSKIKNSDDLSFISTMGFRGEALSSIAAVSRMELVTKCAPALSGVRVTAEGGILSEPEEIGSPQGTTVIVRDLFYNVPARKKFLKSARSEGNQVYDTMVKLALSRPDVSVSYLQDSRAVFQTSGNDNLKETVYRIFGKEVSKGLIPVGFGDDELGVRVTGFLGAPSESRSNREMEYFFINDRTVLSKVFSKALEEGGTGFFMQHRFPVCFLYFSIDTDRVDVNVHPSKLTVRLPDEPAIYELIREGAAAAYRGTERVPDSDGKTKEAPPAVDIREAKAIPGLQKESAGNTVPERGTLFDEEEDEQVRDEAGRDRPGADSSVADVSADDRPAADMRSDDVSAYETPGRAEASGNAPAEDPPSVEPYEVAAPEKNESFEDGVSDTSGSAGTGSGSGPTPANTNTDRTPAFREITGEQSSFELTGDDGDGSPKILSGEARPAMKLIGQAFGTYWFIEYGKKLLVMDQHAAHEKVKFERIRAQLLSGEVYTQLINPPFTVNLTPGQSDTLETYREELEKMGFETDPLGGETYALRSVPAELFGFDPGEMLSEILDELKSRGKADREIASVRLRIATMACKAAVKGNTVMTFDKAEALLNELVTLEEPYHCPHGRPTIVEITETELERRFKRIQD